MGFEMMDSASITRMKESGSSDLNPKITRVP